MGVLENTSQKFKRARVYDSTGFQHINSDEVTHSSAIRVNGVVIGSPLGQRRYVEQGGALYGVRDDHSGSSWLTQLLGPGVHTIEYLKRFDAIDGGSARDTSSSMHVEFNQLCCF